MVEINNQRKAFLDMLAWSEGTDNGRQKNQKSWLWRHCRRWYWLLRSPQTCHAKPKLNQQAPDATSASFPLVDAYRKQLGLKDSLRKSQDARHCSRLRSGALPYDWSWWYPSGNRPLQQYLGFTAGRWRQFHKADSLIAKFKEAGGTVREIDVWAESPRLSPLWLSASSSGSSWAVNHYRDNAITYKAQRDKNARELKLWTRQLLTCRCVSVMLLRSMQIHEGVSWCWAENDAYVMMLPLVVVGCTSKQSVSQCEAHHRLRRG